MRDFWRSHPVGIGEFATRFAGSVGPVRHGRPPAHRLGEPDHRPRRLHPARPGLLRRQAQRGQRRGQPRRDQRQPLLELRRRGPHRRPGILALRARQSRAMLTTLLLSFGVPLLLGGDEMGRTQGGNNNAYCQDNEITWFDWASADTGAAGLHPAADRVPPGPPGVPPPPLPGRRRGLRAATGSPRRARAMDGGRLGRPERPGHRASTWTAPMTRTRQPTARSWSTTTSWSWSIPGGNRSTSFCPKPGPARSGTPRSTATTPPPPRKRLNAVPVIR